MEANERRERAAREAAEWFQRLDSELPREDRAEFVTWLHESPVHVAEMIRMDQIHGALRDFVSWDRSGGVVSEDQHDTVIAFPVRTGARFQRGTSGQPGDTTGCSTFRRRLGERRRIVRLLWVGAAAALAMLILTTGVILPKLRGQIIDTQRGERRQVALDDGSIVLVDPETSIRVKYDASSRGVFLERGRALFRVAKDASRPFLVYVDGTVVRAIGTAFGVEQQTQGVVVTVAEGKVAVLSSPESARSQDAHGAPEGSRGLEPTGNPASAHPRSELKEPGPLFLTSDQQVTVPRRGAIETVRTVDSGRELAWAEGRLVFSNWTVARVVKEFNRYNRVQLEVTDPALAGRNISGVFNASDPESFLSFLGTAAPISVHRPNEHTIAIALSRTD